MRTYTSDISKAGTDADVYVALYGPDGNTRQVPLCPNKKDRRDKFERGSIDTFVIEVLVGKATCSIYKFATTNGLKISHLNLIEFMLQIEILMYSVCEVER